MEVGKRVKQPGSTQLLEAWTFFGTEYNSVLKRH